MSHQLQVGWIVPRNFCFVLLIFLSCIVSWGSLSTLARSAVRYEQYSHILLILPVSLCLVWLEGKGVLANSEFSLGPGLALGLVAATVWWLGSRYALALGDGGSLSVSIFAMVISWLALVVLFYGTRTFKTLAFPLLFLFLLVPIPELLLGKLTLALQQGSTEATYLLFRVTGIPVARNGFQLSIPGLDIEVATQCSGIRSSVVLLLSIA